MAAMLTWQADWTCNNAAVDLLIYFVVVQTGWHVVDSLIRVWPPMCCQTFFTDKLLGRITLQFFTAGKQISQSLNNNSRWTRPLCCRRLMLLKGSLRRQWLASSLRLQSRLTSTPATGRVPTTEHLVKLFRPVLIDEARHCRQSRWVYNIWRRTAARWRRRTAAENDAWAIDSELPGTRCTSEWSVDGLSGTHRLTACVPTSSDWSRRRRQLVMLVSRQWSSLRTAVSSESSTSNRLGHRRLSRVSSSRSSSTLRRVAVYRLLSLFTPSSFL